MSISNKICGVYKISCLPTGRCYIGSSIDVGNRLKSHLSKLRNGKHNNSKLQRDFAQYGESLFEFKEISRVSNRLFLNELEQWFIQKEFSEGKARPYNCNRASGRHDGISMCLVADRINPNSIQEVDQKLKTLKNELRSHPSFHQFKSFKEQINCLNANLTFFGLSLLALCLLAIYFLKDFYFIAMPFIVALAILLPVVAMTNISKIKELDFIEFVRKKEASYVNRKPLSSQVQDESVLIGKNQARVKGIDGSSRIRS